ncbi:uncharacterized protein N7458_007667 [Penicillium daleae]|uniref:PLC-like phosphodiesterase n=1 Tax=Penicillium daleae TaxID=63821 RepID=A0AAD6C3B5_9EURO|nr:uncharacterized protein N7458_007667 [Penicillium daleae]KAJ5443795.1 hypothetical protein N7458_007667 [Penicillium daleae]
MRLFNYLLVLLPAALANQLNARSTTACNNSPDLCNKSYGEITHLGAHDSPFVRTSDSVLAGDQYYDTPTQLSAGVRLLSAQVHKDNNEWRLCHTSCTLLDAGLLSDWLAKIKSWLDEHPNEVVTLLLVNSDSASASELGTVFNSANISTYAYDPPSLTIAPSSWPTLQTLINSGKRLVVFATPLTPSTDYPYLMSEFDFMWENNYDVTSPSNFTCEPDRPSSLSGSISTALSSDRLPMMNHFLYSTDLELIDIEYPNASYVSTTNAPSGGTGNLGSTAAKCKAAYGGRQPTFILVDFFDKGPALDTVDSLNNVTNAVGRTSVSSSSTSSSGGSTINNVFKGLVEMASSAKSGASTSMGDWVWAGGNWNSILGGGISF